MVDRLVASLGQADLPADPPGRGDAPAVSPSPDRVAAPPALCYPAPLARLRRA